MPATVFKGAYESLGLDVSSGKSVGIQKIWHLIQTLMGGGSTVPRDVSKKMSLVIGARRHLEWGHEKYIIDTIQSHPAQVPYITTALMDAKLGTEGRKDLFDWLSRQLSGLSNFPDAVNLNYVLFQIVMRDGCDL